MSNGRTYQCPVDGCSWSIEADAWHGADGSTRHFYDEGQAAEADKHHRGHSTDEWIATAHVLRAQASQSP